MSRNEKGYVSSSYGTFVASNTPYSSNYNVSTSSDKFNYGFVDKSSVFLMKCNINFNVSKLLALNINRSRYYYSLKQKKFADIREEIISKVNNVQPFISTGGGTTNTPSTAFCLLYKLFKLKLTEYQVMSLIKDKENAFLRLIGFLFIRYVCPPSKIWSYMKPFIKDKQSFTDAGRETTVGEFVKGILTEQKYYGTLFPRIPKIIETDIKVEILKLEQPITLKQRTPKAETSSKSAQKPTKSTPLSLESTEDGEIVEKEFLDLNDFVKARYSGDGKWYEAQVTKVISLEKYEVKYTKYGDKEVVKKKHLKFVRSPVNQAIIDKTNDELLRKQVEEEAKRAAVADHKSEYSKHVGSLQNQISVPLHSEIARNELRKSTEAKLVDPKSNGAVVLTEVDHYLVEEEKRKKKRRLERLKQLENMYGNAVSKPK